MVEITYRCTAADCGTVFSDPEVARSFLDWENMVREHLSQKHGIHFPPNCTIGGVRLIVINDFLEAQYHA